MLIETLNNVFQESINFSKDFKTEVIADVKFLQVTQFDVQISYNAQNKPIEYFDLTIKQIPQPDYGYVIFRVIANQV